jgi:hypothetical protein
VVGEWDWVKAEQHFVSREATAWATGDTPAHSTRGAGGAGEGA